MDRPNRISTKSGSVSFLLKLRQSKLQVNVPIPTNTTDTPDAGGSCLPDEGESDCGVSVETVSLEGLSLVIPEVKPSQSEEIEDIDEQSHLEFLDRMESLTTEDSEQYALALKPAKKLQDSTKSRLERLPFDLQNQILNYLSQSDVHSSLLTCKIMSTHASTQIIRCIRHKNVVFRHQLLIFTFMLRNFVGPERLVDELNDLHEVSAGLGRLFARLYEDNPVKYLQYRSRIEKEFNNTLEFRKLFAVFVNIVDILLGAFE